MAIYDLEEQEQLATIKAWWEQYGNLVTTMVTVIALALVGWQGWRWYQNRNAAEAEVLYFELQQAAAEGDAQIARDRAGVLISKYDGTLQAQLGALLSAGVQFQQNDLDNARPQLEWAAKEGKDPVLRDLARLRLATVLLQQGSADGALERLQPVPEGSWKAWFEDLRGDALAAQGKADEARKAWQAALDALEGASGETANLRGLVRAKLESLEG
jgi:predicted negative regulator of RcsB-dependent stress response